MAEIGVASVFGFENTAVTGLDENPLPHQLFSGATERDSPSAHLSVWADNSASVSIIGFSPFIPNLQQGKYEAMKH